MYEIIVLMGEVKDLTLWWQTRLIPIAFSVDCSKRETEGGLHRWYLSIEEN